MLGWVPMDPLSINYWNTRELRALFGYYNSKHVMFTKIYGQLLIFYALSAKVKTQKFKWKVTLKSHQNLLQIRENPQILHEIQANLNELIHF